MRPLATAAAAFALLAISAPGTAMQDSNEPILVDAMTTARWANTVGHSLNHNLRNIKEDAFHAEVPNAILQVRFEVEDGQAVNVRMIRASGTRWLDKAATRAVADMDDLPALPAADRGRTIQANIVSARNSMASDRLMRELQRSEAERIASADVERTVLALNLVQAPAG